MQSLPCYLRASLSPRLADYHLRDTGSVLLQRGAPEYTRLSQADLGGELSGAKGTIPGVPSGGGGDISIVEDDTVVGGPILFRTVNVTPIITVTMSLGSTVVLSFISLIRLLLVRYLTYLLVGGLGNDIQGVVCTVLKLLVGVPLFVLFQCLTPGRATDTNVFLPLLTMGSLVTLRYRQFTIGRGFGTATLSTISTNFDCTTMVLVINIIHRVLNDNAICDMGLGVPMGLPNLLVPFNKFLLLNFVTTTLGTVVGGGCPRGRPSTSFSLSRIGRSRIVGLHRFLSASLSFFRLKRRRPRGRGRGPRASGEGDSTTGQGAPSLSIGGATSTPTGDGGNANGGNTDEDDATSARQRGSGDFNSSTRFRRVLTRLRGCGRCATFSSDSTSRDSASGDPRGSNNTRARRPGNNRSG